LNGATKDRNKVLHESPSDKPKDRSEFFELVQLEKKFVFIFHDKYLFICTLSRNVNSLNERPEVFAANHRAWKNRAEQKTESQNAVAQVVSKTPRKPPPPPILSDKNCNNLEKPVHFISQLQPLKEQVPHEEDYKVPCHKPRPPPPPPLLTNDTVRKSSNDEHVSVKKGSINTSEKGVAELTAKIKQLMDAHKQAYHVELSESLKNKVNNDLKQLALSDEDECSVPQDNEELRELKNR
jgi:hypothetical protein